MKKGSQIMTKEVKHVLKTMKIEKAAELDVVTEEILEVQFYLNKISDDLLSFMLSW